MAEESKYITKKKKPKLGPQARAEEGKQRKSNMIVLTDDNINKMLGNPELGKDIIILEMPDKNNKINYRSGGRVCKLATKGKGKAYGKNS
jgi:hypothetical protein